MHFLIFNISIVPANTLVVVFLVVVFLLNKASNYKKTKHFKIIPTPNMIPMIHKIRLFLNAYFVLQKIRFNAFTQDCPNVVPFERTWYRVVLYNKV